MAKPVQRFQTLLYNSSTTEISVVVRSNDLASDGKVRGSSLIVELDVPERLLLIDVRLQMSFIEKRILAKSLDILRRLAETGKV
jgi:hypothetical protein